MPKAFQYKNRGGEEFSVVVHDPVEEVDHWRFTIVAEHQNWGAKQFTAVVRKSLVSDKGSAEDFHLGDPIAEVRDLLDQTIEGKTPMQWPELGKGWV